MKKALIVIDPQKGFDTKHTKGIASRIRNFIKKNRGEYAAVVFTQYRNHPKSFFVKHLGWKGFMKPSEYGIMDELADLAKSEKLFSKNTYGSFTNKKLENFLKKKKITDVHIAGMDTENCVLTFARDAFDRGFRVTVLKALSRSHSNPRLHKAALEIIKNNIGNVK